MINNGITKKYKINAYLPGLILSLFLYTNMASAQVEVGRCYLMNRHDQSLATGYCAFAWRLRVVPITKKNKEITYLFDSTFGPVDRLMDLDGKLQIALGPRHNEDQKKLEWSVLRLKDQPHDIAADAAIWHLKAGENLYNLDVICYTETVKNEAGSDYNKGCFTYNYNQSGAHRSGYIGRAGVSNGGPIQKDNQPTASQAATSVCSNTGDTVVIHGSPVHVASCENSGSEQKELTETENIK